MSSIRNVVHALKETNTDYQKINNGSGYHCCVADTSMADTETLNLCFKTPTDCLIHIKHQFSAKAAGNLAIYEDATWSGGKTGVQRSIIPKNRYNQRTSHMYDDWGENVSGSGYWGQSGMMKYGVSGLSGNLLCRDYVFASKFFGSSEAILDSKMVLKTGTQYAYVYTANAATNAGQIILDWDERPL